MADAQMWGTEFPHNLRSQMLLYRDRSRSLLWYTVNYLLEQDMSCRSFESFV
jgi:hypothetical protein